MFSAQITLARRDAERTLNGRVNEYTFLSPRPRGQSISVFGILFLSNIDADSTDDETIPNTRHEQAAACCTHAEWDVKYNEKAGLGACAYTCRRQSPLLSWAVILLFTRLTNSKPAQLPVPKAREHKLHSIAAPSVVLTCDARNTIKREVLYCTTSSRTRKSMKIPHTKIRHETKK